VVPAAPALTVTSTQLAATASWTEVVGAETYQLRRTTSASCTATSPAIYTGTATSYTNAGSPTASPTATA
jgi:hypothetical protein